MESEEDLVKWEDRKGLVEWKGKKDAAEWLVRKDLGKWEDRKGLVELKGKKDIAEWKVRKDLVNEGQERSGRLERQERYCGVESEERSGKWKTGKVWLSGKARKILRSG